MTVNTTTITSGPYTAAGGQTLFDYTFRADSSSDIDVYVNEVLRLDYTVLDLGEDAGGQIEFTSGLTVNDEVYIRSSREATQDTEFSSQGGFYPEEHERAFDKLTYLIQQLGDKIKRTLRIADTKSEVGVLDLVAGKFVQVNATGDGFQMADRPVEEVLNDAVINSVADLAFTAAVSDAVYNLKEYHAGTGRGGGHLLAKSGLITPNNVTTFASATVGVYFERTNITGRLNSSYAGLLLDGVTLETARAQAWLDAAVAYGGAKLLKGTLLHSGLSIPSDDFDFIGLGKTISKMRLANSSNQPVILLASKSSCKIQNIGIHGNKANNTVPSGYGNMGISCDNNSNDNEFIGLRIENCYTSCLDIANSDSNTLSSSILIGSGSQAVRITATTRNVDKNAITRTKIRSSFSGVYSVAPTDTYSVFRTEVSYCDIRGCTNTNGALGNDGAIIMEHTYQCEVIHNEIHDNQGRGIHVFYKTTGGNVSYNKLTGNGFGIPGVAAIDIGDISEDNGLTIDGNKIISNANGGIYLTGVYDSVVSGNTILNNGMGTFGDLRVLSGIIINDPSGTGFYDDGTPVTPGTNKVQNNIITNNIIKGSRNCISQLTGTITSYDNNLYQSNRLISTGGAVFDLIGETEKIFDNPGYNPRPNFVITVGASPFGYINKTNQKIDLYIDGGTVSSIAVRGTQVFGSSGRPVSMWPGDQVVITYSAAPNVVAIPA